MDAFESTKKPGLFLSECLSNLEKRIPPQQRLSPKQILDNGSYDNVLQDKIRNHCNDCLGGRKLYQSSRFECLKIPMFRLLLDDDTAQERSWQTKSVQKTG